MKTSKLINHSLAIAFLIVGLSACKSTTNQGSAVVDTSLKTAPESSEAPTVQKQPAEGEFLATDFAALDEWMNTRFIIEYRRQTPDRIFNEVPLDDIKYNTSNLPVNAPKFDFDSESVSRRELLKAIADHWDLSMEYEIGEDGTPSAVNVSG